MYTATERIWLDKDGKPTTDRSQAVSLLIAPNQTMSDADAARYGLTEPFQLRRRDTSQGEPTSIEQAEAKAVAASPEHKMIEGPTETKGVKRSR